MSSILLVLIGVAFGMVISHVFELTLINNKTLNKRFYRNHTIIFGYHIHHSTYGLACVIAGIVAILKDEVSFSLFCIATGVGIIIMHTLFDGRFIFIEKE